MTTQDPPAPVKNGDIFAGKYLVDRVIGSGAMGVVVVATHVQLHEQVVLKFLRHDVAQRSDVVARFLREARSAVRIRNEHVARMIDVDTTEGGLPYIVMEYLEGRDLQEVLRSRGTLAIGDAVDYVAQACLAMVEAHAAGVVHRDLKPSNLFLTHRSDGSSLVKVLDFGISKVVADSSDQTDITSTNGILGSPIYISPEQARSARSVDARADVWSLGVILHHLLAGRPPFIGDSITEVLSAILFSPPARLTEARPDAPPELEAVILKCLTKEIEERMPSAAKLAEALAPWSQPESRLAIARISSAPPPPLQVVGVRGSSAAHFDAAARTMTGWTANGLRLRTPALAKVGAGGAVLALMVAVSGYLAHHRSAATRPAPTVTGPASPAAVATPVGGATTAAAARLPAVATPADAWVGSEVVASVPPVPPVGSGSSPKHAPGPAVGGLPRPAKAAGSRSSPVAPPAVVNRTPSAPPTSTAGIDPGTLTFDLGVKPSSGQSTP